MIFLLMVNLCFLWMMRKNKKRANWVSEVDGTLSILKVHYEVVRDQDSRTFPFIFCFLFIYLFIFILAKKILNDAIFICTTQHQELTLVSFLQQSFPF